MGQEVSISNINHFIDKCLLCFKHEYVSDEESFNIIKNIKVKYFSEEIDTSFYDKIRDTTETYLIIIDCLKKIEIFLENLNKTDSDILQIKRLTDKYNKIYFIKSSKNCLPPGADRVDRRSKIFFDEFEGSVYRYYNVFPIEKINRLKKNVFYGNYSIDLLLLNIKSRLALIQYEKKLDKDLELTCFKISKMDIQQEKILYSSSDNEKSKIKSIYFLENISRIHGVIVKQQGSRIILPGDKNSLIFYDSSLECELVYPPLQIARHTMNKYPRYIVTCFFN